MARPCKCRWIGRGPDVTAFKPCGVPGWTLDTVELGLDELEAIRLADLEGLYQEEAAERMGVSRPTFGRLVESGRRKVAEALLGPKMLMFKGGVVMIQGMRTFACADCGGSFQMARGAGRPGKCPSCDGKHFHRIDDERGGRRAGGGAGRGRCCRHRGAARGTQGSARASSEQETGE
jgi:uncharacterized protein